MPERQVGVRQLKSTLSECVREVKAGGTIVVTEHGRPVARIIPEDTSLKERLDALVRSGVILWNGKKFKPSKPVARNRGPKQLSDLVIEDRR